MMIFVRIFYWVYLDISDSLESTATIATPTTPTNTTNTTSDVQRVGGSEAESPITISRLYQSTEFYGDNSVFKKRRNIAHNLPAIINEEGEEPNFVCEMSNQGNSF